MLIKFITTCICSILISIVSAIPNTTKIVLGSRLSVAPVRLKSRIFVAKPYEHLDVLPLNGIAALYQSTLENLGFPSSLINVKQVITKTHDRVTVFGKTELTDRHLKLIILRKNSERHNSVSPQNLRWISMENYKASKLVKSDEPFQRLFSVQEISLVDTKKNTSNGREKGDILKTWNKNLVFSHVKININQEREKLLQKKLKNLTKSDAWLKFLSAQPGDPVYLGRWYKTDPKLRDLANKFSIPIE